MQMRWTLGAACALSLGIAGVAHGQSQAGVVVELFTSQGCSACPPADAFLAALAADPRVIPLALHVDYWDYIGWEDQFADARFTQRQKSYARAIGSRTIYTPQMIVGGTDRVEGNAPEKVAALILKHMQAAERVGLWLERDGDVLRIHAEADPPLDEAVRVQLVRYRPEETVAIEHGENEGRTVTYRNIVTSWEVVGDWGGQAPLSIEAKAAGSEPLAVILQNEGPGAILAAASLR
ncbi:DUF1223 domain-containing protein [Cereibacter sphaeroides]|uniref:DUF1223 domain-containing protein n=1 Tax=Cereibacter sphaeroides TaxID=1063 RepID=UPI000F530825|nr:DUF1223 domain-containing protein [Cereibacter sphaeroides]AZB56373.1 DUF1223 domain-containing protein [Cereibacter sphaeroides]AZB60632.1 DUF1223 domain-containing protein [Cereibacter sphaeroides]